MRFFIAVILSLGLLACDEAPQTGGGSSAEPDIKARAMMRLVAASAQFQDLPQACPLAIYQSKGNVGGPVPDCFARPRQCMTLCEAGNRKACFDAAQVIEKGTNPDDNRATFRLYMEGCARGDGNACVNAGATVKNTVWSGGKPARAATAQCQYTTYRRMCDDGHPWGCFMTAKEYLRSDGARPKSETRHDQFMRRACRISTTSGACLPTYR